MSPRGALHLNPNGNATRFVSMGEVFSVGSPRPPGQPPDAAQQPGSGLERTACTARPSGTESRKRHPKRRITWAKSPAGEPRKRSGRREPHGAALRPNFTAGAPARTMTCKTCTFNITYSVVARVVEPELDDEARRPCGEAERRLEGVRDPREVGLRILSVGYSQLLLMWMAQRKRQARHRVKRCRCRGSATREAMRRRRVS